MAKSLNSEIIPIIIFPLKWIAIPDMASLRYPVAIDLTYGLPKINARWMWRAWKESKLTGAIYRFQLLSILWRRSLPVRKKGACFSGTNTSSPVRGLRPARDLRVRVEKAPKPRSSTRAPCSSVWVIVSNTTATTRSTSRRERCSFSLWRVSISSDRSIGFMCKTRTLASSNKRKGSLYRFAHSKTQPVHGENIQSYRTAAIRR